MATYDGRMICVDPVIEQVVWNVEPEGGFPFYASPAVAGERVIFAGRDGVVRGLNKADGREVWRFPTKGKVDSSPVIVGDRVFFGSSDGSLYAVALSDGRKRWSFAAGAAIVASPAVGEGRLVIGARDGAVYCFGVRGDAR